MKSYNTKQQALNEACLQRMGYNDEVEEELSKDYSRKGIGIDNTVNVGDVFTITGFAPRSSNIEEKSVSWWTFTTAEGKEVSFRALFGPAQARSAEFWAKEVTDLKVAEGYEAVPVDKVWKPVHASAVNFIQNYEVCEYENKRFMCVAKGTQALKGKAADKTTKVYAFVLLDSQDNE